MDSPPLFVAATAFAREAHPAHGVLTAAAGALADLFVLAGVDDTHGFAHAMEVSRHALAALDAAPSPVVDPASRLAVLLAALLHDADDKKYFPDSCATYGNAGRIMRDAGAPAAIVADALYMISLVSCSANGNSFPAAAARPEVLYPRWADRLEAIGVIGVLRCVHYSFKARTPIALDSTPRPDSDAGIFAAATAERFAAYHAGAPSASIVDHFYDKLLHVARMPPDLVRNQYLVLEAAGRVEPLLDVCRAYSAGGEAGALDHFRRLGAWPAP